MTNQIAQNNTYKQNISYSRLPVEFKRAQHLALNKAIKDKNYNANYREILRAIINRTDKNGKFNGTQEGIARELTISSRTVSRAMKKFKEDGLLDYRRSGNWKSHNTTDMLFLQHLNSNTHDTMSRNINNLNNLKDNNINTNYSEYVSCSSNKKIDKLPCTSAKAKGASKRVSQAALSGPDPDGEVMRICLLYALTESQTLYAVMRMRQRDMNCPARYLSAMAKGLSNGTWIVDIKPKKEQLMSDYAKSSMSAYKLSQDAIEYAKKRMEAEGYIYPTIATHPDGIERYDALQAYSTREGYYRNEYLKQPSGPRPIEEFPPKLDWVTKTYE